MANISPEAEREREKLMARFHAISWVLATGIPMALLIASEIAWPRQRDRPATAFAWALGIVLTLLYFNVLYWIYDKHVNRAETPGCFLQLVFFGFTGLVGGLILVVVWDLMRWIQYVVMRPPTRIHYCVSTPGFLYSGRKPQDADERA
jgi:hypothetical protein